MNQLPCLSIGLLLLSGCVVPGEPPRLSDIYEVCNLEMAKLREVHPGMTEADVKKLMGPASLRIFNGYRYEHEPRPFRREARRLSNGREVVILYFRARVVHHDTVCTLDETEAVVLLDGKVESLFAGDRVEHFLQKL